MKLTRKWGRDEQAVHPLKVLFRRAFCVDHVSICKCVFMYVNMYVCMYVCMMYVCIHACLYMLGS